MSEKQQGTGQEGKPTDWISCGKDAAGKSAWSSPDDRIYSRLASYIHCCQTIWCSSLITISLKMASGRNCSSLVGLYIIVINRFFPYSELWNDLLLCAHFVFLTRSRFFAPIKCVGAVYHGSTHRYLNPWAQSAAEFHACANIRMWWAW
jgi:hypothetical protein